GSYNVTFNGGGTVWIATMATFKAPPAGAAATQLAFFSAARTVANGGCAGPFSVRALNAAGVPAAVSAPIPLDLTTNHLATGSFWQSPSCTGVPIEQLSLPAGASTLADFYYRDTTSPYASVSVSDPTGGLTSATQVVTI